MSKISIKITDKSSGKKMIISSFLCWQRFVYLGWHPIVTTFDDVNYDGIETCFKAFIYRWYLNPMFKNNSFLILLFSSIFYTDVCGGSIPPLVEMSPLFPIHCLFLYSFPFSLVSSWLSHSSLLLVFLFVSINSCFTYLPPFFEHMYSNHLNYHKFPLFPILYPSLRQCSIFSLYSQ